MQRVPIQKDKLLSPDEALNKALRDIKLIILVLRGVIVVSVMALFIAIVK